jgi:hypothetical protein
MLLPPVPKLLLLVSLAAGVTAAPAPALAIDNTAMRNCESDYARCLRLRMSLDYCHETVCNMYNNEVHLISSSIILNENADKCQCKPCQDNALPTVYDRAITCPTNDNTAGEVQVLNGRAGAKPAKNHCIVICTHAHCGLLCADPGQGGRTDETETATDTDTADLLDLANAQPDQLGVPLEEGMTTVITNIDAEGKLEGNCTWVCSGKVSCRLVCCDSAAASARSEAQCSLITDGGALPEGEAVEGAGKCEIVKKNKVAEIMVCQLPEAAGGDALTAGLQCVIYWFGLMPQLICRNVH